MSKETKEFKFGEGDPRVSEYEELADYCHQYLSKEYYDENGEIAGEPAYIDEETETYLYAFQEEINGTEESFWARIKRKYAMLLWRKEMGYPLFRRS